jgi:hypothetical protein
MCTLNESDFTNMADCTKDHLPALVLLGCVDGQIVTDVLKDHSGSLLKVKQSKPSSVDVTVRILLIDIYIFYFKYCL